MFHLSTPTSPNVETTTSRTTFRKDRQSRETGGPLTRPGECTHLYTSPSTTTPLPASWTVTQSDGVTLMPTYGPFRFAMHVAVSLATRIFSSSPRSTTTTTAYPVHDHHHYYKITTTHTSSDDDYPDRSYHPTIASILTSTIRRR
ncbi:hypothetical protein BDN72DRAFT_907058 [Pluteus cervinus]|uniref:Uncharacterized protein n=1 Tax=Pluteus cervinus TaxID=181527 RepID=A0ACD2ZXX2_9AGAR|nr:hypothetical protein BDN72DRAFT_907058 [Pluteus cervinus]